MTDSYLQKRPRLLDLFCGAGGAAMGYHRKAILIELNESYCELAAERLSQQSLFAEAM